MIDFTKLPFSISSKLSEFLGTNEINVDNRRHVANTSSYTHYSDQPMSSGRAPYVGAVALSDNLPIGSKSKGIKIPGYIPQLDKEVFGEDRFGPERRKLYAETGQTGVDIYNPKEGGAVDFGRKQLTYFEGTRTDYQKYRTEQATQPPLNLNTETVRQFLDPETVKETFLSKLPMSMSSLLR